MLFQRQARKDSHEKKLCNRFARANERSTNTSLKWKLVSSGPIYSASLSPSRVESLARPFRVATSRFSRPGAHTNLRTDRRLLTDSTGSRHWVPRMTARRATMRSRIHKRRGDFVMKNFRLASGSACQASVEDERPSKSEGHYHYFP